MQSFNARNVAKYVVKTIIAAKVADTTATAIVNYTDHEEDELIVRIPSHIVGWGVADKVQPYSDAMVDKTANWLNAKRNKPQETPEEK